MNHTLIYLVFGFLLASSLSYSAKDTKRQKGRTELKKVEKGKFYYTDPSLCEFAARFVNENEIILSGAKFLVGGNDSVSIIKIRVYGNEGGDNVPTYQNVLTDPIIAEKKKPGNVELEVKFTKPISIKQSGYFISFETISGDARLISTKIDSKCYCASPLSGEYYPQALKNKSGDWFTGKYKFAVIPIYNEVKNDDKKYFKAMNISEEIDFKANVVSVADINADIRPDLIINGKVAINKGDFKFELDTNQYQITDDIKYQTALDIDKDGDYDILIFGNRDSITNKLEAVLYKNIGKKLSKIPLKIDNLYNPTSVVCDLINADDFPDLLICQEKDTLIYPEICSLVLINNRRNSFEVVIDLSSTKNLPAAKTGEVLDINNDGKNEVVLVTSEGTAEFYSLNENGNIERILNSSIEKSFLECGYNFGSSLSDISFVNGNIPGKKEIVIVSSSKNAIKNNFSNTGLINLDEYNSATIMQPKCFSPQTFQSGICAIDVNNDGFIDYITMSGDSCRQPNLYISDANGGYRLATFQAGFNRFNMGKDAVVADLDLDGKMDVVTIYNGKLQLFRNDYTKLEKENNYISFVSSNGSAIKNIMLVPEDSANIYTPKSKHGKSLEVSESVITIGLGDKENIKEAILEDEDGNKFYLNNLIANKLYRTDDFTRKAQELEPQITAWPTPFETSLFIKIEDVENSNYHITIKNNSGSVIATERSLLRTGQNRFCWNGVNDAGQPVSNGIYFIELQMDKVIRAVKVSKVQ